MTVVIATAGAAERAAALATFFTAAYAGLALPVLGLGVALQFLTPRVTLLIFAVAVGLGILAAAPFLVRQPTRTPTTRAGVTHHADALSDAQEHRRAEPTSAAA